MARGTARVEEGRECKTNGWNIKKKKYKKNNKKKGSECECVCMYVCNLSVQRIKGVCYLLALVFSEAKKKIDKNTAEEDEFFGPLPIKSDK